MGLPTCLDSNHILEYNEDFEITPGELLKGI